MGYTETLDALVLKTYDVGEADRFCILLSKERGKITARACGVRRPTSSMGGTLLPFVHVTITTREGKSGRNILTAKRQGSPLSDDVQTFARAQYLVDVLLRLIPEEEPLPEIFSLVCTYLALPPSNLEKGQLSFLIQLLSAIGIFALSPDRSAYTQEERHYVHACMQGSLQDLPTLSQEAERHLVKLTQSCMEEHIGTTLPHQWSPTWSGNERKE